MKCGNILHCKWTVSKTGSRSSETNVALQSRVWGSVSELAQLLKGCPLYEIKIVQRRILTSLYLTIRRIYLELLLCHACSALNFLWLSCTINKLRFLSTIKRLLLRSPIIMTFKILACFWRKLHAFQSAL